MFHSIPPVGPLQIGIRTPTKPSRVSFEPGAHPLSFEFDNGITRLTVPGVEIHNVLMVEP